MSDWLGEFEQLVLFAVLHLGADAYGASVRDAIEERTGRRPSAGAIYTTLDRLESRGLVTSWWGEPTRERGGKRKRHYRLESEGREALSRSWTALRSMARGTAQKLGSS